MRRRLIGRLASGQETVARVDSSEHRFRADTCRKSYFICDFSWKSSNRLFCVCKMVMCIVNVILKQLH